MESLIPYARNARTHSDAQVAQIAASIQEWGWTNPVLIDETGSIIAGHGRVLAARQLGFAEAPVMVARGWSEAQRRAYVLADNKLAEQAGWDKELLALEVADLSDMGFDLALTGFSESELKGLAQGFVEGHRQADATIGGERNLVLIECEDEQAQALLFEEMQERGYVCKILS